MHSKLGLIVILAILGLHLKAIEVEARNDNLPHIDYDYDETTAKTTAARAKLNLTTTPTVAATEVPATTGSFETTTTKRLPNVQPNLVILSSHGVPCLTSCHTWDNSGCNWCKTARTANWEWDWDYCSPVNGTDYKHRKCVTPCAKYREKYTWCRTTGGNWGYCSDAPAQETIGRGREIPKTVVSSYGVTCLSECAKGKNTKYFWCSTERKIAGHNWDYCSPVSGHDYKGKRCTSKCGHEGKNYKWCYVTGNSWGYC